ncbi:hypothetical protein BH09GEM1_BH09GEM1_19090 [soil metagenome]
MSTKKTPSFKMIPAGISVTWDYRIAIGHGSVIGIHKRGTTAASTMYSIREHDHHLGEPAVVFHSGNRSTPLSHASGDSIRIITDVIAGSAVIIHDQAQEAFHAIHA